MEKGLILIVIGMIMIATANFMNMAEVSKQKNEVEHQKVLVGIAKADGHMQGFMDGCFWGFQNPCPTNETGQLKIDLNSILQAHKDAWNRRQEER